MNPFASWNRRSRGKLSVLSLLSRVMNPALSVLLMAWFTSFSALSVEPCDESAGVSCVFYTINDLQTLFGASQSRYWLPFFGSVAVRMLFQRGFSQPSDCEKSLPVCEHEILLFLSGHADIIRSNRRGDARRSAQFGTICESTRYRTSLQKRRNSQSTHRPRCFVGTDGIRSAWTSARISVNWRRTSFRRRVVTGTRTARRAGIR